MSSSSRKIYLDLLFLFKWSDGQHDLDVSGYLQFYEHESYNLGNPELMFKSIYGRTDTLKYFSFFLELYVHGISYLYLLTKVTQFLCPNNELKLFCLQIDRHDWSYIFFIFYFLFFSLNYYHYDYFGSSHMLG